MDLRKTLPFLTLFCEGERDRAAESKEGKCLGRIQRIKQSKCFAGEKENDKEKPHKCVLMANSANSCFLS
jgi:hypothetical protein